VEIKKKKKKEKALELKPGCIVIAKPFWEDDVYKRSVILIVEHNTEHSLGLIINKESTVQVEEALPDIDCDRRVFFGGTFERSEISFLHTIKSITEAGPLTDNLYVGGDTEKLTMMLETKQIDFNKIRFIAGRVQWQSGMLEKEIKEENKWWVSTITAKEIFEDNAPETLWSFKLLQSGNMYGLFAHVPDPSINERKGEIKSI